MGDTYGYDVWEDDEYTDALPGPWLVDVTTKWGNRCIARFDTKKRAEEYVRTLEAPQAPVEPRAPRIPDLFRGALDDLNTDGI